MMLVLDIWVLIIHKVKWKIYISLQPLFTMSVQQQSIQPFTEKDYERLTEQFGSNAVSVAIPLSSV